MTDSFNFELGGQSLSSLGLSLSLSVEAESSLTKGDASTRFSSRASLFFAKDA